ncbi:MAG: O-antigen ligase family protein [Bacteroidota bacterium]
MKFPPAPIPGRPWRVALTLLAFACIYVGLIFSPVLLSIGLVGLPVVGVLDPEKGINPSWIKGLKKLPVDPIFWSLALLYLIIVIGFWQTYDWDYYLGRLRIKSVLMAAPIAWVGLPQLRRIERDGFIVASVLVMAVTCLVVVINYIINWEAIDVALRQGQPVPVPRNHIRFSLLVAITTILALDLAVNRAFKRHKLWLALAAFLFIVQHVLAVRSGLVLAYGGLAVYGLIIAIIRQSWKWLLAGAVGLIAIAAISVMTIPSLQARWAYLKWELHLIEYGHDNKNYSDNARLTSIRVGWQIWKDHPWLGVGPGNLLAETDARYQREFDIEKGLRPHNQIVSTLAGSGLLGGILFCTSAGGLIFGYRRLRRDPLYMSVAAILFGSMMVENTLETSAGVAMFTFFILLLSQTSDLKRNDTVSM